MDVRIHRLWLLVFALLFTALIGPPVRAQVSSIGTYPVEDPIAMSGTEFSAVATVVEHETYDVRGVLFFELKFKGESVTVSADADTVFAKALRAHHRGKARITITSADLQEISR